MHKNNWNELDDFSLQLSEKMARKIIKSTRIGISILNNVRTNFFKINNITRKQFVEELTNEINDILQLYKPIKQKRKTVKKDHYKNLPREDFSEDTKIQVLRNQDHRCAICGKILDVYDWDHIDGDRSNNDISNCRALCPSCHAKITRRRQSKK